MKDNTIITNRNSRVQLRGQVAANHLTKTITVVVTRKFRHPVYKKTISSSKKYLVHDENQVAKIDDKVLIMATRPLSARKHFCLVKVIETKSQK